MKNIRYILYLVLGLFLVYVRFATVSPATVSSTPVIASQTGDHPQTDDSIPPKVLQVLQIVRSTGQPPEGYVGGRVFQNREGRLPADGDYREFDVDPHNGGRDAERIIVEWGTKKAWYTADHYRTFTPLP
jgi:ribonuclease T1